MCENIFQNEKTPQCFPVIKMHKFILKKPIIIREENSTREHVFRKIEDAAEFTDRFYLDMCDVLVRKLPSDLLI